MQKNSLYKVQEGLYIWLSNFEKRSYTSIKQNCDYLNTAYNLGLGDYAVWYLFYPLLYCGVADHVGNGYYALTNPICYKFGDEYVFTNLAIKEDVHRTLFVGINMTKNYRIVEGIKTNSFDAISILKTYPSLDAIVDGFPKSVENLVNAEYYNWKNKKGVTKRFHDGIVRYFSIPELMYQREIPGKNINPDAFSIAFCYGRVINNEYNGQYDSKNKVLMIPTFACVIMTFRILFLESLSHGREPQRIGDNFYFYEISSKIIKELNRIYCNTIRYE